MQKQRKVVSLTVHKNTLPKRRGRENARLLGLIAKDEHRQGDVAEFDFRYNNREKLGVSDKGRTDAALSAIVGKRLTYRGPCFSKEI